MTTPTPSSTKRKEAECLRCGYKWTPRKPISQVRECPSCKSYGWRKRAQR